MSEFRTATWQVLNTRGQKNVIRTFEFRPDAQAYADYMGSTEHIVRPTYVK